MKRPVFKASQETLEFARKLRAEPSALERRLWPLLRNRKLAGAKFRRQARIGGYIVDFACLEACLIIEIDGAVHQLPGRPERDAARQQGLESEGYRVVRFTDRAVYDDVDRVVAEIERALLARVPSPPAPLPQGERGEVL